MRIAALDIIRYRALSDVRMNFAPGAKVHLVYGPQEAGKSTALAAIADGLFGMPRALQPNAVRFPVGDLRIGMALVSEEGERLEFRRRKADRDTLLAADQSATLPDHTLAPYLAGMDRDTFEASFGLTSERLRAAGDELASSGGDAGSALLSASSGLAGLADLGATLTDEADALFGRKKADRRFWKFEAEHAAAKQREDEAQLKASHWTALRKAVEADEAADAELETRRTALRQEIARLEMLKRAAPVHVRIAALGERLSEYDDLAQVPEGYVATLERLAEAQARAGENEAREIDELAQAQNRLEQVAIDEQLLTQADAVQALMLRMGAIAKAEEDLPRRRAERDEKERGLARLAEDLGLTPDDLAERRPTAPDLAHLAELVRKGRVLEAERDSLSREAAASDKTGEEDAEDPTKWEQRYEAITPILARLETLPELEEALAEAQRSVEQDFARLTPAVTDPSAAAKWNLPEDAVLERLEDRIENARADVVASEREVARVAQEAIRLDAAIAEDHAADLVTREQIETARTERDRAVRDGADFIDLITHADALADRAFENASDVAMAERRLEEQRALNSTTRAAHKDREAAKANLQASENDLRSAFLMIDIGKADAPAMLRWSARVSTLRERWNEAERMQRAVEGLRAEAEAIEAPLAEIADGLGLNTDGLPIGARGRMVAKALKEATDRWRELGEARAVAKVGARKRRELDDREKAWRVAIDEAAPTIAMQPGASLAALERAVAAWERVPDVMDLLQRVRRQVRTMGDDIESFQQDVAVTVALVLPELDGLPPGLAVERMSELCASAKSEASRKETLTAAVTDRTLSLESASKAAEVAQAELDAASAEIEGDDALAFAETTHRLNERDEILKALARGRDEIGGHLAHIELDEIGEELEAFDPIAADLQLERLQADDAELYEQSRSLHTELTNRRAEIARLEAAGGAEEHAFARNAAASRMAETGREWLVLRAGALMLEAALAKARAAETGPWLARASALFSGLTASSFERVEQDWSTGVEARLVGVRPDGEQVATDGMSEGTRDQLYLALRLAHLSERANAQGTMPFIGDDIFMTFDRARTRNGITALASISDHVQPILFTHHDFVVEEAQAALGVELDLIDLTKMNGIRDRIAEEVA